MALRNIVMPSRLSQHIVTTSGKYSASTSAVTVTIAGTLDVVLLSSATSKIVRYYFICSIGKKLVGTLRLKINSVSLQAELLEDVDLQKHYLESSSETVLHGQGKIILLVGNLSYIMNITNNFQADDKSPLYTLFGIEPPVKNKRKKSFSETIKSIFTDTDRSSVEQPIIQTTPSKKEDTNLVPIILTTPKGNQSIDEPLILTTPIRSNTSGLGEILNRVRTGDNHKEKIINQKYDELKALHKKLIIIGKNPEEDADFEMHRRTLKNLAPTKELLF